MAIRPGREALQQPPHHRAQGRGGPVEPAVHACPSHPDVHRIGPGRCERCGAPLEAIVPHGHVPRGPATSDAARRLWIGVVLTLPLFMMETAARLLGWQALLAWPVAGWVQAALASPVVLWSGAPLLRRAWRGVGRGRLEGGEPAAIAILLPWLLSLAALVLPGAWPPGLRLRDGLPPLFFDTSAAVTVLLLAGCVVELRAAERRQARGETPRVAAAPPEAAAAAVLIALLAGAAWGLAGPQPAGTHAVGAAVAVLAASVPRAFAAAAPATRGAAALYHALALPLAAGVLFPAVSLLPAPLLAAAAGALASIGFSVGRLGRRER
jgi:cation transport ATPase